MNAYVEALEKIAGRGKFGKTWRNKLTGRIVHGTPGLGDDWVEVTKGDMPKLGADMPPFLEQDRPKKVKEIYSALKREHPDMPAEMKARIAARQGKRGKQHQGPPYKGPIDPWKEKKGSAAEQVLAVKEAYGQPRFAPGDVQLTPKTEVVQQVVTDEYGRPVGVRLVEQPVGVQVGVTPSAMQRMHHNISSDVASGTRWGGGLGALGGAALGAGAGLGLGRMLAPPRMRVPLAAAGGLIGAGAGGVGGAAYGARAGGEQAREQNIESMRRVFQEKGLIPEEKEEKKEAGMKDLLTNMAVGAIAGTAGAGVGAGLATEPGKRSPEVENSMVRAGITGAALGILMGKAPMASNAPPWAQKALMGTSLSTAAGLAAYRRIKKEKSQE